MPRKKPPHRFILCRAEVPSSSFLRLSKFCKYYRVIISVPTYCVEKIFLPPEIHEIEFSFILKPINSSFLLNTNFPFVQSSCFYNFFLSKKLVPYNHFNYTAKRETELKNFFLSNFLRFKT